MPDTRRFQQTLFDLQKRYGDHVVQPLSERSHGGEVIRTGFSALDEALGQGGVRRGQLGAFVGTPTSGMTTVALKLLASAQGTADAGVYLDAPRTFDGDYAALYGVAADRLLVAQPEDGAQALEIARDFGKSERAALVIIDLWGVHTALDPTSVRRLHDALATTRTAVLFLCAVLPPTLESYLQTCLSFEWLDWLRDKDDVSGYRVRVNIIRNKPYPAGQSAVLDIEIDPLVEGDDR